MPRLFTALEVPPAVGAVLSSLRGGLTGARWIDPENYHITLRFVGDVDERMADRLADILADVRSGPIEVALTALDAFGGDRPRSIFAAVAPSRALSELQAGHESAARRLGLPPETRKFVPHVTLARLKDTPPEFAAAFIGSRGRFPTQRYLARRFVLFSSRDSVGGGPYIIEAAYDLA